MVFNKKFKYCQFEFKWQEELLYPFRRTGISMNEITKTSIMFSALFYTIGAIGVFVCKIVMVQWHLLNVLYVD